MLQAMVEEGRCTCEVTLKGPKWMMRPGKGGMSACGCCELMGYGVMKRSMYGTFRVVAQCKEWKT